ncbi:MAG: penicillin-binding protein 2 [Chloroflexota bacterium]|nr:penicillin-binding protein 2 [Chloroflexota bacterium]
MQESSAQQATIQARLPFVAIFLILMAAYLVINLANFQFFPRSVRQELEKIGSSITNTTLRVPAERGLIFDRDGEPLAFNIVQYRLGVSPALVADADSLSSQVAEILDIDEFEVYRKTISENIWEFVAGPISAEKGQALAALDEISLGLEEIPKRFYPQGTLAAHVIGIVLNEGLVGSLGVEGAYNDTLAGRVLDLSVSNVPFDLPEDRPAEQRGQDIVLTIDRDIQFWVESELKAAVDEYRAFRGTAIVMNPRNGDVLALANYPTMDPNNFLDVEDPSLLENAAVQETYEPGSIIQALTVASALERGAITPYWTYNDTGQLSVGGRDIWNRHFQSHGSTDAATILIRSLNAGAATISLQMGTEDFYSMMRAFGLGQATGVGLFAEDPGEVRIEGETNWNESYLGFNSFGQDMKATSMQLITAFAAIANDGVMRQPRIVRQVISEDGVEEARPTTVRRVLSAETAASVRDMLIRVVREGAPGAYMRGYTIAGKPGTAWISTAVGQEYGPHSSIVTFAGFFPAYDPEVVIFVKLDRPNEYYGYNVTPHVFRRIADRIVILLEIPNDEVRSRLEAAETDIVVAGS